MPLQLPKYLTNGGHLNHLNQEQKQWILKWAEEDFMPWLAPTEMKCYNLQKYISISPKDHFKILSAFADENENPQLPGSEWSLNFTEESGTTKVTIVIFNESLERMEKMIAMGFKEGFAMAHDNLDEYLASKK